MALLGAWASYQAALDGLRDQIVKRGELLGTALNEAAKATRSDDELRFAVEEIVGKESSVYGIAVARLTGYSTDEFLGRNPRFLHGDERKQPGLDEVRAALKNGRGCKTILRNFRKDGTEFWNDFTLSPVCDNVMAATDFFTMVWTHRGWLTFFVLLAREKDCPSLCV